MDVVNAAVDGINGDFEASSDPVQLSFCMPNAPQTRIQLHLTLHRSSIVLFLTSTTSESGNGPTNLGSFVYALPNLSSPSAQPLSTPLYPHPPTLDFATRLSKVLARRTRKPTYVGNSISFASAGMGGTVEEEIEGFKAVVEVVMREVTKEKENDVT
ncbi:hypothetical protein M501DRAFT_925207 [Patellaria atrata CBS 101060]|uniref:Uncharacterized protein n=1 Tax=Patellaria atrata CBS 101060 TaxID=1346257 RepID=A0A9P4SJ83_9PEZI|nr:hypothetical protein M501DRAFT_925207 [Patellaria atrata CBS 101060]